MIENTAEYEGITYRKDTNDLAIIKEKMYNTVYERIQPNDIILDIGSHIGSFAIRCLVKQPKKIICIEPSPRNIDLLKTNLKNNPNTEIIRAAVTGQKRFLDRGFGTLKLSSGRSTSTGCLSSDGDVTVHVVTFESLLEKYKPNIIKIDIEKEEFNLNFNNVPKISRILAIEIHPRAKAEPIYNVLISLGFKVIYMSLTKTDKSNVVVVFER